MASERSVPYRDIAVKCKPHLLSLCKRWLPHGHASGNWWLASCPWREDKTASLMVSLTTGHWEDRGGAIAGKEGGDMIRLFFCIYPSSCRDMVDAADQVARIVGHPFRQARRS